MIRENHEFIKELPDHFEVILDSNSANEESRFLVYAQVLDKKYPKPNIQPAASSA